MIMRRVFAVALLLLTGPAASAQRPFEHNPQKDPYRNLFGDRDPVQKPAPAPPVRLIPRAAPPKPVVVCGTLIIPADPSIDPKIRVGPPDDGVDYKIRIVPPPVCRPQ
jgi:hypothetical protein